MNAATPIMDLSHMYEKMNTKTRQMQTIQGPGGKLLKDKLGFCVIPLIHNNQHSLISLIVFVFCNMHDLLVDELRVHNAKLTNDEAFNLARQINVAMYQNMWYNEILPLYIGTSNSLVNSLEDTFNSNITPQIFLEFFSAAWRFPHILTQDNVAFASCTNYTIFKETPIQHTNFNQNLPKAHFQDLICGSATMSWKNDGLSPGVQNMMFYEEKLKYGKDLFAIDAYRTRESCLEPYVNYLQRFFGVCINNWDDLNQFFSPNAIELFKEFYARVEDLELHPAGLLENIIDDSHTGPTFTYMILKQFEIIKNGDPKFFTHAMNAMQIKEIGKINFTNFFCIAGRLKKSLKDMKYGFEAGRNDVVDCTCNSVSDCMDVRVFLKQNQ